MTDELQQKMKHAVYYLEKDGKTEISLFPCLALNTLLNSKNTPSLLISK